MKYLEMCAVPPCSGTTPRPQLSRQMARARRHRALPSLTPRPRLSRRLTRSLSSSTRVAAAPASAEHSAPAVFPVACLGGVSSRPDGWAHPGGRRRKMCCGAAWPAWSAGGPHRITKCNANGWERVTARNYISKQSTMVQNSVQWARWPGPAQRRGRGVTAADRRSTAGSVIRIEHRSSGSLRPSASVH